ncbi:L-2-amino-thiazoline-4-carboxylic acid hydrolase [bacterium]|nr:L-2-amino-thiazoline-4-carboxylic acid hydrolase [bacterium]
MSKTLAQYGNALNEFPRGLLLKQARIFLSQLRRLYGTLGLLRMMVPIMRQRRRIQKTHRGPVAKLRQDWGSGAVNEALTMTALFNTLPPVEGREGAYEVLKGIFQEVAPHSMKGLYQSDDLAHCDGDRFANFKAFHKAMFDASHHLFPNTQTDEGDLFTSTVTQCANVEVFTVLEVPELGRLGCDHDLAGYPAIADRHDFEFRRPCTIAKGADACEFRFYRKGTAPDTEVIDGVSVPWDDSLNR